MSKKVAFALAMLLAIAAGVYFFARDRTLTPEEFEEQLLALAEAGDDEGFARLLEESAERNMNGPIDIRGVVQDEAGRPLSGVTVRITTTHIALNADDAGSEDSELSINGEFKFRCKDCSAIEAEFSKDGFHTVDREWISFAPGVQTPGLKDRDVVVTLQARGTPASLEPYRGILESGGRTRVLPLSFGYGSGIMSPERVIERAKEEGNSEPLYLQLLVDTEPNGSISIDQSTPPGASYTIDRPRNPRLDFSTARGGVIGYEPREQNVRLIDREMSLAPSSGYADTLDIVRRDGLPQYFYCRIGNRYRRGIVNPAGLAGSSSRPSTAEVSVSIELNVVPGDRNLTPRH